MLNGATEKHQYPLPVPEDLFTKLNGGKYFAKLDLSDAYLQVEVDPDFRELLTINTSWFVPVYPSPIWCKVGPRNFSTDYGHNDC